MTSTTTVDAGGEVRLGFLFTYSAANGAYFRRGYLALPVHAESGLNQLADFATSITVVSLRQPDKIDDPLTAVLRSGARRLELCWNLGDAVIRRRFVLTC